MPSERAAILSPADVRNIRSYVQRKYAGLPTEEHSEIVTDAMQRIVMRQLPDFPEEIRLVLVDKLLQEVVSERQRPVGPEHVFAASLSIDLGVPRHFESLHAWAENQLQQIIEREDFQRLVETAAFQLKVAPDSEELQTTLWHTFRKEAIDLGVSRSETAGAVKMKPSQVVVKLPTAAEAAPFVKRRPKLYGILFVMLTIGMLWYGWQSLAPMITELVKPRPMQIPMEQIETPKPRLNELPEELRYAEIDREQLTKYLNKKNSLLAEPEYRDVIIEAARVKDIHPLLLFAITGQEQAFVPRTHKMAKLMVNNPFNVYHSYLEYNTTLSKAAKIAGNTINRLSKDRPSDVDPIQWINREYAEDKNWWKGVSSILNAMRRQMNISAEE